MYNTFTNIPGLPYNWKEPVLTVSVLPPHGNTLGDTRVALDTFKIYIWNGSSWAQAGGGISSINGDTSSAQFIVGGTGISVSTVSGTTTISTNAITALTGDVTATGPGSVPATLATVNSNIGSFGSASMIPTIVVNGKGLVTSASASTVTAGAGNLTGTTLNSGVVTSSLTTVGTIGTGVWQGTAVGFAYGGTNNINPYTAGSVIYSNGTSLTQDNSLLFLDVAHQIFSVGTNTPVVAWTPSSDQSIIMVNGTGDGTANDFPVFAFSQNADGPSPYTQGALYWINNNPGDAGEYGVIASIRQDGTNQFSGAGVSNGFVFSARQSATDPNPATDILRIFQASSNVLIIDAIAPNMGAVEYRINNHMCFSHSYDPTYGVIIQADGSYIKDDGNNLGVFGGVETLYQSAYKFGFFGTGGVRIGTSDGTWHTPTYLLEIAGVARDSYTKYYNNASTSGLLVGIDSSGNAEVLQQDAFPLSLGVNNTAAYQITTGNTWQNLLNANEATGAGTATLGTNCPAVTPTSPYTWIKMISSDGSTVYVPAFK